jgi:hypothetical protein
MRDSSFFLRDKYKMGHFDGYFEGSNFFPKFRFVDVWKIIYSMLKMLKSILKEIRENMKVHSFLIIFFNQT